MATAARSEQREYAYPRDWYAAVIADALARATSDKADCAVLDVASSFAASFRPIAFPAAGHDYRLPDGSLEHDGTYVVLPRAEKYEDRDWGPFRATGDGRTIGPHRPMVMLSTDAGGGFVRDDDGRIVRDRREVAQILAHRPDLARFALALMPEPAPSGRKRRQPWTVARGLLFSGLRPLLGTRPAARRLLSWEHELDAPWRVVNGSLASRAEAGDALDAGERRKLRTAENAMLRSCARSGVEPRP